MAQQFKERDIVSYVGKASGTTIECEVCSIKGAKAHVVWTSDQNTFRMVNLSDLTFIRHHEPRKPAAQRATNLYRCLSCGNKHNRRECPFCGGEDRILNTDHDHDPSYLLNH